jgi:hypothetical protein
MKQQKTTTKTTKLPRLFFPFRCCLLGVDLAKESVPLPLSRSVSYQELRQDGKADSESENE